MRDVFTIVRILCVENVLLLVECLERSRDVQSLRLLLLKLFQSAILLPCLAVPLPLLGSDTQHVQSSTLLSLCNLA